MITIARRDDETKQRTVTAETWSKMVDRGDARKWTKIKTIPEPPTEIQEAMKKVLRPKKTVSTAEDAPDGHVWENPAPEGEQTTTE